MSDPHIDALLTSLLGPELGHVPHPWPGSLGRALRKMAEEARLDEASLLARLSVRRDRRAIARLVSAATVPHTSFFRHPEQLEHLAGVALPAMARRSAIVRVWSAGCATGEEPYSIALAAAQARVPIRILATDVSDEHIAFARAGVYPARSTRGLTGADARRDYVVPDEIKRAVRFEVASLAGTDPTPGDGAAFDLVFCRNVLIYFEPKSAIRMATRLLDRVRPGGSLVVAPSEVVLRAPWVRASDDAPLGFFAPRPRPGKDRGPVVTTPRVAPHDERDSRPPVTPLDLPATAGDAELEEAARALSSGAPDRAEEILTRLLDRTPDRPTAWFLLGEALEARGEMAQARIAFDRTARTAAAAAGDVDALTLARAAKRRAEMLG